MSSSVSKVKLIQGAEERNPRRTAERRCAFEIRTLQRLRSHSGSATERPVDTQPSGSGAFHLLWATGGIGAPKHSRQLTNI
ncbi:hypothetical protein QQF64_005269 [Cirrhinus molitorella]|uniref:Uncharacterized protein n=1 Tax=Cirrhinus molitorella TaxID=172907 RepID=A0ABR3MKK7_9TELE